MARICSAVSQIFWYLLLPPMGLCDKALQLSRWASCFAPPYQSFTCTYDALLAVWYSAVQFRFRTLALEGIGSRPPCLS